jgi:hypothetical protein
MSIVSTDDAESFIKIWMNDRGYSADELKPEGLAFQLNGKFETGVTFSIIQPLTLKRAVVVVAQIDFHPFHLAAIKSLKSEDLGKFLGGLQRDLFFVIPSFKFIPTGASIPSAIQFNKQISYDQLTEGKLYDMVEYTCRCVLWVAWVLTGKFGRPVEEANLE